MNNRNEQTICAVSTPQGVGGLAVIRISGPRALEVVKLCMPSSFKKNICSHEARHGFFYDVNREKVDEVVATYFQQGRSYTGDEVVEISCHGSLYISKKIIDVLIQHGCLLADRGEFTYRAFMNGRIDLTQAESVLSLIESNSQSASRLALRQLEGGLSKIFHSIESDLIWCLAQIEASIDFSTEGLEIAETEHLITKLIKTQNRLNEIILNYQLGKSIKDGIKIVLVGEPNVGKSSLLNNLLVEDKAIVTSIAGTTRDVVEGTTHFEGLRFVLSDTAGLRDSTELVEKIGIQKSILEVEKSDVVIFVSDITQINYMFLNQYFEKFKPQNYLFVLNKADLVDELQIAKVLSILFKSVPGSSADNTLVTTTKNFKTRELIFKALLTKFHQNFNFVDDVVVSSTRQYECSLLANELISKFISEFRSGVGVEFIALHLKEALLNIQKILGIYFDDQIFDRIFKEFCLGK